MSAGSNLAMEPADRVLVIERTFNAPRPLVFKAWTDPERLVQWWGPHGFTTKVLGKMDVRPGGAYRFHMRSAEGDDHWLKGMYREVREPERLACTFIWTDAQGNATSPETVLTVLFEERGKQTKLTLHQAVFETISARDAHNNGWTGALDRLGQLVAAA